MNTSARVLTLLCVGVLLCFNVTFAQVKLEKQTRVDMTTTGALYMATSTDFPKSIADIDAWRGALTPVNKVNLFGGMYWFVVDVNNFSTHSDWVFDPYGTIMDVIDARLYGADGSSQILETGYQRKLPYSLHYGQNIRLEPNMQYRLLVRIGSPYFASQPGFRVMPQEEYQQHVLWENFLTIGALGAILCLAFYNLFIFASTRDPSLLFYALYLAVTFMGWAWTFHIPTALFNVHELRFHYMWFFLIPITSTLFYLQFLQVAKWSPLLAKLSWGNIILSAILLPSSFFALPYTHTLATLCISIQLTLAIVCGVISWRRGFKAARYFIFAFIFLLIPGLFILPANVGLIPDLLENAELITLLGTTLDGLFLAFALAERIRSLQAERDSSLQRFTQALELANTDSMTKIGNRHAFDEALKTALATSAKIMLMLIDLDGLKRINDQYGHAKGDELLQRFAAALQKLSIPTVSSYRLGGDEFTLIAEQQYEARLRTAINTIELELRQNGFPEFGASVGVAYGSEHQQVSEVFSRADARMYQDKANRKTGRTSATA